eukprot:3410838-Pyramimonas_sp.AAC.1
MTERPYRKTADFRASVGVLWSYCERWRRSTDRARPNPLNRLFFLILPNVSRLFRSNFREPFWRGEPRAGGDGGAEGEAGPAAGGGGQARQPGRGARHRQGEEGAARGGRATLRGQAAPRHAGNRRRRIVS